MKTLLKVLILALVLAPFFAAQSAPLPSKTIAKQSNWVQLKPDQQRILAPLAKDWDQLPDIQRQRILGTSKHYPKMSPAEQKRYSERLLEWSQLPMGQRNVVRERFKQFQKLPPEHKEQIKQRWEEQHPTQQAQPEGPGVAPTATPATDPSSAVEH